MPRILRIRRKLCFLIYKPREASLPAMQSSFKSKWKIEVNFQWDAQERGVFCLNQLKFCLLWWRTSLSEVMRIE